jgi:hypothetical protein
MSSDEALKPCPFCGGTARMRKTDNDRGYVSCAACKATSGGFFDAWCARDAWNQRRTLCDEEGLRRAFERICFRWLNGSTKEWPLVPALLDAVKERVR